jgi:hypothetical protein
MLLEKLFSENEKFYENVKLQKPIASGIYGTFET